MFPPILKSPTSDNVSFVNYSPYKLNIWLTCNITLWFLFQSLHCQLPLDWGAVLLFVQCINCELIYMPTSREISFNIGTWNIWTLWRAGLENPTLEVYECELSDVGLSEVWWFGKGKIVSGNYTVFCSDGVKAEKIAAGLRNYIVKKKSREENTKMKFGKNQE